MAVAKLSNRAAQFWLMAAMVAVDSCTPNRSAISAARRFSGRNWPCDAGNPGAILHRGLHIRGKVRTGLGAARRAAATVGAVLGHDEGLRLWQVEHLPGDVIRRHRFAQRLAAPRAGFGEMIDRGIDGLALAQGLAGMSLLSARLLAGPFAQTADANRLLLQAVAGRRFPAVAAVQAQLAFQLGDPRLQLRDSGLLRRVLVPQYRIDRCRILGNRRGFVARIVCRRTGHTMVGVRLLPLPQHLIHLSSQFAAPKPNLPILGSYEKRRKNMSDSTAASPRAQSRSSRGSLDGSCSPSKARTIDRPNE